MTSNWESLGSSGKRQPLSRVWRASRCVCPLGKVSEDLDRGAGGPSTWIHRASSSSTRSTGREAKQRSQPIVCHVGITRSSLLTDLTKLESTLPSQKPLKRGSVKLETFSWIAAFFSVGPVHTQTVTAVTAARSLGRRVTVTQSHRAAGGRCRFTAAASLNR